MLVKNNYFPNKILFVYILLISLSLVSCNKKDIAYDSITGTWRVEESNPINGTRVYIVDIDRSKDTTQYLISNFFDADINEFVYAQLKGATLSIPDQTITSVRVKSGTGIVSSDFTKIDFIYNIYDGSDITVHATYTRPD